MTFTEEQEQEYRDELYYVRLYNERARASKFERHTAIANKTIKIAKCVGIEADDDCFDIVENILIRLNQVDEFLKLETE